VIDVIVAPAFGCMLHVPALTFDCAFAPIAAIAIMATINNFFIIFFLLLLINLFRYSVFIYGCKVSTFFYTPKLFVCFFIYFVMTTYKNCDKSRNMP